jgi:hypothetical protein
MPHLPGKVVRGLHPRAPSERERNIHSCDHWPDLNEERPTIAALFHDDGAFRALSGHVCSSSSFPGASWANTAAPATIVDHELAAARLAQSTRLS